MNERAPTVWRDPDEESLDLYPGLVVDDARVSGSITTGRSRLPLWAFLPCGILHGWSEAESGWSPSEYGFTAERAAEFIGNLLEMRGEFARLLLVLANADRIDEERQDRALEGHGPVVRIKVFDTDPDDAVEMPRPWWEVEELRGPVIAQLRRCLEVLEAAA